MLSRLVWVYRTKKSNFFQLLDAYFLDIGLPDLCRHPGRSVLGLLYLLPLSGEYVYFLCSPLPQSDVLNAYVSRFQGCLPGLLSRKDSNLVALSVLRAKEGRQKMHMSRSHFSELLTTMKDDIEVKPYHFRRIQKVLVLK